MAKTILSAVAVPVLIFFGLLCTVGCGALGAGKMAHCRSPMMEIPEARPCERRRLHQANKPDAGMGCFMAAALYAITGMFAFKAAWSLKTAAV